MRKINCNQKNEYKVFKIKVLLCLINVHNCSLKYARKTMRIYRDDFMYFYLDGWTPDVVATAMMMGY